MNAFDAFWSLDGWNFHLLNDAYMILLCNKIEAHEVKIYHPINLINSFKTKLVVKCLAVWLTVVLD